MDISKYFYNEVINNFIRFYTLIKATHYTKLLRNLTLDYNNHADFSLKKINNERQSYINSIKDKKVDDFTESKQLLYDLMWRLTHSIEEKFLKYYN